MTSVPLEALALPNTLGLQAIATQAIVIRRSEQLSPVLTHARQFGETVRVLGSGSNVVLPRVLEGISLLMRIPGITSIESEDSSRRFEVGGGESWQGFVRFCIGQGLGGGIENLTLIPGTVGAAPIQNIGAYGVEVAEFIEAVEVLDRQEVSDTLHWKPADECEFGYRDSCFKQQAGRWVITRVRFKLPVHGQLRTQYAGLISELTRMGLAVGSTLLSAATVADAVARTRRRKLPDPRQHPNAGSFFKNPMLLRSSYERLLARAPSSARSGLDQIPIWEQGAHIKLSAAALIDKAGWKERPATRVGVWQRQPLVLVNRGGADAHDVKEFAQAIVRSVEEQFGVVLEQEPRDL